MSFNTEKLGYSPNPEIILSEEVSGKLTDLINQAHHTVYIKTLQFSPTDELHQALEAAVTRQVEVAVFADNPHRDIPDLVSSMSALYTALPDYIHPTYRWANPLINAIKDLKIKGIPLGDVILREHDKAISIDGKGLVGGVNINPYDFNRRDFLISFPRELAVAKAVHGYLEAQVKNINTRTYKIDENTQMLVESHQPFDWGIYSQACRWVAAETEAVNLTTPLMPIGRLLHTMLLKSQEIPVSINLSSPDDMWYKETPYKELFNLSLKQMESPIYRGNQLNIRHAPENTHAKVLQVGHKVIFGSHNFWEPGIFGLNREMVITSTDPHIVDLVSQAVKN